MKARLALVALVGCGCSSIKTMSATTIVLR
jgi:hypothetical protein